MTQAGPPDKKRAANMTLAALFSVRCAVEGRSGRLVKLILILHRTGILTLGADVAVDKFDDRDLRRVRRADARLDDAGITAGALSGGR
jgi:hypothetical protein